MGFITFNMSLLLNIHEVQLVDPFWRLPSNLVVWVTLTYDLWFLSEHIWPGRAVYADYA